MDPFLKNIASAFWHEYHSSIGDFTFVFPNRRSGIFFHHYLFMVADQTFFTPKMTTISDLMTSLSSNQKTDRITLLFYLYESFREVSNSTESFDEFYYWGEMLLNDFEDIDKYLVDDKQLFQNISDIKEIEDNYNYLTPEQIEIIRRFWVNFLPLSDEDVNKTNFYKIWEILKDVYQLFKEKLKKDGMAFEGMIFKEVVANMQQLKDDNKIPQNIVFIGLNAHSKSEFAFLSFIRDTTNADFYWDYNSPLVADRKNSASRFIDINLKNFQSKLNIVNEDFFVTKPNIQTIGIPSAMGQTKYVYTILKELEQKKVLTEENLINTAIVLPDENLLLPTLYSIPESIDSINVTMGYKLTNSPIVSLMNNIFEMQQNISSNGLFYIRNVSDILNHKYVREIALEKSIALQEYLIRNNRIRISKEELTIHPFLKKIFVPQSCIKDFAAYLKDILSFIQLNYYPIDSTQSIDNSLNANTTIDIEKEFNIEYYKTICQLEDILSSVNYEINISTYIKFIRKTIQSISIPFEGEPLSGLQVMGVLETRALDFDNLIIVSMNEGIFPSKKIPNSFIPYTLRKGFELPTYEHQDAIYAYHFYRLISRAKNIFFLYDSRTDSALSGEISRYYNQIKHIYADSFNLSENLVVYEIATSSLQTINIAKNEKIQEKLKTYLENGENKLSASSLNMYIDCPLQFYFSVIEKLSEQEDVEETIEASMFGTIFHYIMEKIYQRYINKVVTADTLDSIIKDNKYLDELLLESFQVNFYKNENRKVLTGQNYLVSEIIKKYVKKVLSEDSKLLKFKYIYSELKLDQIYDTGNNKVNFKGFIDRIDLVGSKMRIIDYKTGKGNITFNTICDLFDKEKTERPKAIMQVFLYSHLYLIEHPDVVIEPNIYYLRNLYDSKFDTTISQKFDKTKTYISNFDTVREDFKLELNKCLDEIFDINIPFTQTTTNEPCQWCSFSNICKK